MERSKFMKLLTFLTALSLSLCVSTQACTLFAAQGDMVAGMGTLVAKNRDYNPGRQTLKLMPRSAENKYAVYALYGNRGGLGRENVCVGGVNEKGLAVVVAMASSIPGKRRNAMPKRAVVRRMLANCANVEEALQFPCLGPRFLLVADKKEIACIEVGADGQTAVKRMRNGYLVHTNHYLAPEFEFLNIRVGDSSLTRLNRVTELLESQRMPFTLQRFQEICNDRNDGPDNSVWRIGGKRRSQTLASFIVDLHADGDFNVYVKYRPLPEDIGRETVLTLTKQDIFGK